MVPRSSDPDTTGPAMDLAACPAGFPWPEAETIQAIRPGRGTAPEQCWAAHPEDPNWACGIRPTTDVGLCDRHHRSIVGKARA